MTDDRFDEPTLTADQALAHLPLSGWARLRYALLAAGGLAGAVLVASLWATEPGDLPARTHAAFAGLIAIGLAWSVFGTWVTTRRHPLFAAERVIAGWIALTAALATTIVTVLVAAVRADATAVLTAAAVGAVLVAAAALLLRSATTRRAALRHHKRSLEHRDH